ncbi:unnamed protein product [Cochlearia groenlandica]
MASKSLIVFFLVLAFIASSVVSQAPRPSPTRSPLPETPSISQPPKTAAPAPSRATTTTPTPPSSLSPVSPPAGSPSPTFASPPAPPTSLTPDGSPAANAPSSGPGGANNSPPNGNDAATISAGYLVGFVFCVAALLL